MWRSVIALLLIAYLPGALIFRLPVGERSRRAALAAEERVFWSILLSVVLSSFTSLGLAAAGWYRFNRLLWINGAVSLLMLGLVRGRLRFGPVAASSPTSTALLPVALVVAGAWLNFLVPPSEYIMGGRDPGVYMNEGIQIAQRGTLVITDETARSVPPPYRELFFAPSYDPSYYSSRFLGFFLLNPGAGTVVGQFPHMYPAWIAIAYGINGLSGARWVLDVWAVLGLLAVYFAGLRIVGRAAATAGAGLLAVHVVQIWYARYPNAEMVMQPLLFAGLLSYLRATLDKDRFFAPVAALMLVVSVFVHFTGVLAVAAVAGAAFLAFVEGERPRLSFGLLLVAGTCLAVTYLAVYIPPYFRFPVGFVRNLRPLHLALLALAAIVIVGLLYGARHPWVMALVRRVPAALVVAVWSLAAYAVFIRSAGGALALHDADSLRTFTSFYLSPFGLAAALIGFALVARSIASAGPFLLTMVVFSVFFFYKIRIVPEHFWAARRFLAIILPGSLLLVGAAAFSEVRFDAVGRLAWLNRRGIQVARYAAGLVLVLLLGRHFLGAAQPILRHVEYAGLIPRLERLASTFGDNDLVLVEARGTSDVHVLAVPLAYIYARNVLVLARTAPNKEELREFLTWARGRYRRIFFVGGSVTGLLSRTMPIEIVGGERFRIPEYESAWNAYPRRVRLKEFDFPISEFLLRPAAANGFALDVGAADDLYVRRFHAKERGPNGFTYRWTQEVSYVLILGTRPDQQLLTLWLGDGGRPAAAGPADVEMFLNDRALGAATVGAGLRPYRFAIPPDLAAEIAQSEDPAQLRIVTRTWNPSRLSGARDDRDLGVMVDRIEMR